MSTRLSLDKTDAWKITKGVLIHIAGATLGYLATTVIPDLQNSGALTVPMGAFFAGLVNAAIKFLSDSKSREGGAK